MVKERFGQEENLVSLGNMARKKTWSATEPVQHYNLVPLYTWTHSLSVGPLVTKCDICIASKYFLFTLKKLHTTMIVII